VVTPAETYRECATGNKGRYSCPDPYRLDYLVDNGAAHVRLRTMRNASGEKHRAANTC
jgi:hypothetical protein